MNPNLYSKYTHPPYLEICQNKKLKYINPDTLLTKRENDLLHKKLKHKQEAWLLGREAAKKSIQRCYMDSEVSICTQQIEILNDVSGKPYFTLVTCPHENHSQIQIHIYGSLSISHSGDLAVACFLPLETKGTSLQIGIDIEHVRFFKPEIIQGFMTEHEFRTHKKLSPEHKIWHATILWSLKEAYLKSIGVGLRTHPKTIDISFTQQSANISLKNKSLPATKSAYWTIHDGSYIISSIVT